MYSFAEYLFKMILEQAGDTLPVYYSESFKQILQQIVDETGNEVAERLLMEEGKEGKRVFIDVDRDSIDKISFLMANKAEEILGRRNNIKYLDFNEHDAIYNARQRGTMKINRFVNDLFNNEYQTKPLSPEKKKLYKEKGIKTAAQHLEDFVNKFKALRKPGEFEIVKGGELVEWYHESKYFSDEGTLGSSCMMYDECREYLEFYEYNQHKISMLIMKDKESGNLIVGRALLWKLDSHTGRTYMDRVYTNYDYDVEGFKKYAKDNEWLYKFKQNMEPDEKIVDTKDGSVEKRTLIVNDIHEVNIDDYDNRGIFPYLDTMRYYSPESEIISNYMEALPKDSKIYTLSGTEGTDYDITSNLSYEEKVELMEERILDDVKFYAIEMFPNLFWDFIKDKEYMENFIRGEIEYQLQDFPHIYEEPEPMIKYIKNNVDEDKIPKNIDDMEADELSDLMDKLNIKDQFVESELEERYEGYSAKDVYEEMYGNPDEISNEIYDQFDWYFDEDKFAHYIASEYLSEYDIDQELDLGYE